ncbi:glycosyltransferase family 39 protein [Thalassoglobus sp.]|uniref:glycosyltransferase family 39 protein n=1 Tax=Thalassoglobus sp. TaxID=2795869 RepID=UPI003AA8D7E0
MNWNQERQVERLTKAAQAIQRKSQRDLAGEDPTINFFGIFLVAHVLIWTILASLTQPNLPDETLQLLTAGQSPAWGYFDQPPLAVWMMSFVSTIFAPAAWPAYFMAQVCIATCMWAAWKIGKDFLHPWTAICGAIVLEGCFFFTIGSTAFSSAHLAGCFWALGILALYQGFHLEHRRDWVIVGICLGLGMLSHYSTALLILSMVTFSLLNHQARRCWDTSWPFLAGAIAGVIVLPHFWWAWSNDFSTVSTAMHGWKSISSRGQFTIQFLISQIFAVVPILLLLIPVIASFRFDEPTTSEDEERDFVRQYLLVVTLLPAALMFALALIVGVDLGSTGLTLWTFIGVLLLLWSDLEENRIAWRRVILHSGTVGGGFAALLVISNFMLPYIMNSSQPKDIHFPGKQLAKEVRSIWKNRGYEQKLAIIAGPGRLAQNASWYHGTVQRPLAYNDMDDSKSVGVDDAALLKSGGIILWTDADLPNDENQVADVDYSNDGLMVRFQSETQPNKIEFMEEPITLQWGKTKKSEPIRVYVALVHPFQQATEEGEPELVFPIEELQLDNQTAAINTSLIR